ncbi:MAG: zinc metallopeptidase [Pseudomonadota bacterium]
MAAFGLIIGALVLAAIFGPQFWIKHVMRRHGKDRTDLPGTGGELAQHLVDHYQLRGVGVEETDLGPHYDSDARMVRLTPDIMRGRSLTAVAVATHEVGHALQHADGLDGLPDGGLMRRQRLVKAVVSIDRLASIFFLAAPILGALARTPAAFFGFIAVGIGLLAIRLVVHLITLPVEYDASFQRALPLLKHGGYLEEDDLPAVRSVLKAAALTYVAAAAMSLLDLARWIRIIR